MMRRSRGWLVHTLSLALTLGAAAFGFLILTANGNAVVHTFFDGHVLRISMPSVLQGFWLNVRLFLVVEVIVLPWAFLVALLRVTSSNSWALSRWMAVAYVDVFRGIPAVIVIYLIAFGIPISSLPVLGNISPFVLCAAALTVVYGAYVAEEFRAGIDSVHWSQGAAARSLGLTSTQSMLYVIAPQAVRRMVPPLLNQFVALQKDTSLVSFVGLLDAFNRSRIIASNEFNLSAVTGVALFFVIITIPLARLVDYIAKRDAERMQQVSR
jgi:polar amino acid transport system permease protein